MDYIINFISEYLYIILVVGSLIANSFFFKKKEEDVAPTPEDIAREKRAQEIREEIKRRIQEQRRNASPQPKSSPSEATPPRQYDPFVPDGRGQQEASRPVATPPSLPQERSPAPQREPVASAPSSAGQYKSEVEQKMREIKKINERARSILQQNKSTLKKAKDATKSVLPTDTPMPLPQNIAALARNPKLARQAIIYHEIFSPPVGMRRS